MRRSIGFRIFLFKKGVKYEHSILGYSSRGYNHVDEGGDGHDIGWYVARAKKQIGGYGVDENASSSAVGIDDTYDGGGGGFDQK